MSERKAGFAYPLGVLALLVVTACWGSSFIAMRFALKDLSPAQINFFRFAIATAALLPCTRLDKKIWRAGVELGTILFLGYATQLVGLQYTSINRSAFILSTYVIFVPVLAAITGRKVGPLTWCMAVVAMGGGVLLSFEGGKPNVGDLWTLGTALFYAVYILRLERIALNLAALPLVVVQMATMMCLSGLWILLEHQPALGHMPWGMLIFLGLVASALPAILQAVGQKSVPAPQAAIVLMMEPVFGSFFAWMMAWETLSGRGMLGAGMILISAVVSQVPELIRAKEKRE
jgi:drug/metabolite transporter (DMT)-like permease